MCKDCFDCQLYVIAMSTSRVKLILHHIKCAVHLLTSGTCAYTNQLHALNERLQRVMNALRALHRLKTHRCKAKPTHS